MIRIYDLLPVGYENRISTKALCSCLGISVRDLRKKIASERNAGAIILSDSGVLGGYYRPDNRQEIEQCVRILNKKACSIMRVLKSAKQYLEETKEIEAGQCSIDNFI